MEWRRSGEGYSFRQREYPKATQDLQGIEEMLAREFRIRIIPHTHASAAWNLALEHALYERAQEQLRTKGWFDPIVRTYSFERNSVVLGYRQPIGEIDLQYCVDNGIEVTMRQTGGGSVFLNPSDVQYAYFLPVPYTHALLGNINSKLREGITGAGFSPILKPVREQQVLRMPHDGKEKSFVFDAQRRSACKSPDGNGYSHLVWHHGTILVSRDGYDHMPVALKATPEVRRIIDTGNYWLAHGGTLQRSRFINDLSRQLPFSIDNSYEQGFTGPELARAKELFDSFYSDPKRFSDGTKSYGICYIPDTDLLPDTEYDMEKYAVKE